LATALELGLRLLPLRRAVAVLMVMEAAASAAVPATPLAALASADDDDDDDDDEIKLLRLVDRVSRAAGTALASPVVEVMPLASAVKSRARVMAPWMSAFLAVCCMMAGAGAEIIVIHRTFSRLHSA